jgi:hypothetical protein
LCANGVQNDSAEETRNASGPSDMRKPRILSLCNMQFKYGVSPLRRSHSPPLLLCSVGDAFPPDECLVSIINNTHFSIYLFFFQKPTSPSLHFFVFVEYLYLCFLFCELGSFCIFVLQIGFILFLGGVNCYQWLMIFNPSYLLLFMGGMCKEVIMG